MKKIDLHAHSTNSFDGEDSPEAMVISALEKGVSVFALTDHCEINRWFPRTHYDEENIFPQDTFDFAHDFEASMEDNLRLKEKYRDKIKFINGTELGNAQLDFGLAESVSKDKRLDFIIGSVHQMRGEDDFAFINYRERDINELLEKYFEEVLTVCKRGIFDSLGHITYPLRYIEGEYGFNVSVSDYRDIIAECFKEVISRGKCIEVNTSGTRQKYGGTFPDKTLLGLYKDLGGKYITTGSDAHSADDILSGFGTACGMAESLGLSLCFFEHRSMNVIS